MTNGSNGVDGAHLIALIERIERVEQNIREEQEARKEIFSEAKGQGYDIKIMRKVIAIRKQDRSKREEEQALIDLYMGALGMLADLPLGVASISRAFGK